MNTHIKTALVVEDNHTWQKIFRNLLEEADYEVEVADKLLDALRFVSHQVFDVAIVDISLDRNDQMNRDGFTLIKAMKEENLETSIIVVSGTIPLQAQELEVFKPDVAAVYDKSRFDRYQLLTLIGEQATSAQITDSELGHDKRLVPETEYRGRALVIENDPKWQSILKDALTVERLQVETASDAPFALGELLRESYHIVTIDFHLDSSAADDNRDGRHLLEQADKLGIPTIVISGKLQPVEVVEDYHRYRVWRIMDKAGFNVDLFRRSVRDALSQQLSQKQTAIEDDLMYKVVQTLLRNRFKRNSELASKAPIRKLAEILDRPALAFLNSLRTAFEETFQTLLAEVERAEQSHTGVDSRAFPEPGAYTQHLLQLMKASAHTQRQSRPDALQTERMQRMFVLAALYGDGYSLKPLLLTHLSLSESALNRLRKEGIVELATQLKQNWTP